MVTVISSVYLLTPSSNTSEYLSQVLALFNASKPSFLPFLFFYPFNLIRPPFEDFFLFRFYLENLLHVGRSSYVSSLSVGCVNSFPTSQHVSLPLSIFTWCTRLFSTSTSILHSYPECGLVYFLILFLIRLKENPLDCSETPSIPNMNSLPHRRAFPSMPLFYSY